MTLIPPAEPRLLTRQPTRVPSPETRQPRRALRRVAIAFAALLTLAAVAVLVASVTLRRDLRAALPQLDGSLRVPGLAAPVTVTRDPHGVPSIAAQSLDDLLFAQGYITASDRLFQMDALRRHAAGTLAELLGPSLVDHDTFERTLQLTQAADRGIAALPPAQLHQLQAYARGVNAFIDTHPDTLPIEFHILHYHPAPWQPRDSLLVTLSMWQDLSTEFPHKLQREALTAHLPAALAADLYPVGSWRDHPPAQTTPDLTTPRDVPEIPLDATQASLHLPAAHTAPEDLLRFAQPPCPGCLSGSNNWAVSAQRSASGAPLVSNDMHLGLQVPDIWYEAALHTTDTTQLAVEGFSLPGVPFIIVGRNANVAWGVTAMLGDTQDVYIEHLRGAGPATEFQLPDGSWQPAAHHTERIRVRAGRDVTLDVLTTTHHAGDTTLATPILSALYPTEHRPLALAWSAYDPTALALPLLAVNTAADGPALVQAFSTFGGPSLNLVYADRQHIGYHALGRIPIRGLPLHHPRDLPAVPAGPAPADEDSNRVPQPLEPGLRHNRVPQVPEAGPGLPQILNVSLKPASHRTKPEHPQPNARLHTKTPSSRPAPTHTLSSRPDLPHTLSSRPDPERAEGGVERPAVPTPTLDYTIGNPISPVPVDALDPAQQWSGYIPYDQLPAVVDPPSGILATANARITPDDYPYFIANDWHDAYRAERIVLALAPRSNLTPQDMLALQNDVHSSFDLVLAQRLAYALDHASPAALGPDAAQLHQAADLLRAWDGSVTLDSPAAAITAATRAELWPVLLTPHIAAHDHIPPKQAARFLDLYTWSARNSALELLIQHTPARWLPQGVATWDDLLTRAVATGLRHSQAPADLRRWRYASVHAVEIAHPIFGSTGLVSKLLGTPTGTGPHPTSGDTTTVRAVSLHFGPSERFTADLANPDATLANITTGESADPASPHFLDHFTPWLDGTTFSLPLNHPTATHTLILTPN